MGCTHVTYLIVYYVHTNCMGCTHVTYLIVYYVHAVSGKGRVYLLYTGQHYDALVGVVDTDTSTGNELRIFPKGCVTPSRELITQPYPLAGCQQRCIFSPAAFSLVQ